MKTATILLVIITVGLLISGCSRIGSTAKTPSTQTNTQTTADATGAATTADTTATDLTVDTTTTASPDIGTLDNVSVSDELPQ